jgi:hypothetical protein
LFERNLKKEEEVMNKKLKPTIAAVLVLAVSITAYFAFKPEALAQMLPASITIESAPIQAGDTQEIVLDVVVKNVKDQKYLASSLNVGFDKDKLEFLGVKQGDIAVASKESSNIPLWQADTVFANLTGEARTYYLDETAKNYPYQMDGKQEVLLRLVFQLKDSAHSGEVLDIKADDFVLATAEDSQQISTSSGNIRAFNGKILVK